MAIKRKNYGVLSDNATKLAKVSISLQKKAGGRSIPRQDILDALITLLSDKEVLEKVCKLLNI